MINKKNIIELGEGELNFNEAVTMLANRIHSSVNTLFSTGFDIINYNGSDLIIHVTSEPTYCVKSSVKVDLSGHLYFHQDMHDVFAVYVSKSDRQSFFASALMAIEIISTCMVYKAVRNSFSDKSKVYVDFKEAVALAIPFIKHSNVAFYRPDCGVITSLSYVVNNELKLDSIRDFIVNKAGTDYHAKYYDEINDIYTKAQETYTAFTDKIWEFMNWDKHDFAWLKETVNVTMTILERSGYLNIDMDNGIVGIETAMNSINTIKAYINAVDMESGEYEHKITDHELFDIIIHAVKTHCVLHKNYEVEEDDEVHF